jgi:hypothetical protein
VIIREVLPSGEIMFCNTRTRSSLVISRKEEKELLALILGQVKVFSGRSS